MTLKEFLNSFEEEYSIDNKELSIDKQEALKAIQTLQDIISRSDMNMPFMQKAL